MRARVRVHIPFDKPAKWIDSATTEIPLSLLRHYCALSFTIFYVSCSTSFRSIQDYIILVRRRSQHGRLFR